MNMPQRPDQGYDPPESAVSVQSQSGVFIGRRVVISGTGPGSGLFIYNGTPALGNPPILAAVAPGTTLDPFGNPVAQVLNIGNQTGAHSGFNSAGTLFFSDSTSTIRITIDPTSSPPHMLLSDSAGHVIASFNPLSPVFTQNTSGAGLADLSSVPGNAGLWCYRDNQTAVVGNLIAAINFRGGNTDPLAGQTFPTAGIYGFTFTALHPGASPAVPETWQTMTITVAGFSAGSPSPRFQLEGVNGGRVRLSGVVNLTANQVANTTFFTLPAGYIPARNHNILCGNTLTGAVASNFVLNITSGGAMQIAVAGNNGQFIDLDGVSFELD